ncbi:hypothetical protein [Ruegeria sp. HKCCA5491]|uniref:hypothetical protein n=1 Tax=Ruegeria sp. HKCCA5491 TaxID=2682986 RepID=UPI001489B4C4|nr:hypothetical protein [Ruegeria sp. HKCCA5491]
MKVGPARIRLFYLKEFATQADAFDPYSVAFLESFGVLDRIRELVEEFPEEIGDPRVYLSEKLMAAEAIACKLANFTIPEDLNDRVVYLAGRISDERSVGMESTISEIWVTNAEDENLRERLKFRDPVSGYLLYLYTINQDGDRTVPFQVATFSSNLDKNFDRVVGRTRSSNADHLGVLTSSALREIVNSLSHFDFAWNHTPNPSVIPKPGSLSDEITRLDMAMEEGNPSPIQPDYPLLIEMVSADGLFEVDEYTANLSSLFGKVLDQQVMVSGYMTNSSAFKETLKGSFDDPWEVYHFAKNNPSADNWRFVGSVSGLPAEARASAKFKAAELYWFEGRMDDVAAAYNEIIGTSEYAGIKTDDGHLIQDLAKTGSDVAFGYTGPSVILAAGMKGSKIDVTNPKNWAGQNFRPLLDEMKNTGSFSSENWSGKIIDSFE